MVYDIPRWTTIAMDRNMDRDMDVPATYRIAVQGQLDADWADSFDGMLLTCERSGSDRPVTVLTGVVVDQAALHGLLRTLYGLGLPLLAVSRIVPENANEGRA